MVAVPVAMQNSGSFRIVFYVPTPSLHFLECLASGIMFAAAARIYLNFLINVVLGKLRIG